MTHLHSKIDEWISKSVCYQWMYNYSRLKYKHRDTIINSTIISLSALTAIFTLVINNFEYGLIDENVETLIISFSTLLVGGLSALQTRMKLGEKAEKFCTASYNFENYNRRLRNEITLKQITPEVLENCIRKYDKLVSVSPRIPNFVIAKFNKRFATTCMIKPTITYELGKLQYTYPERIPIYKKAFYKWVYYTEMQCDKKKDKFELVIHDE